jgi:hypothetical protein
MKYFYNHINSKTKTSHQYSVFQNPIINAIKYQKNNSSIYITTIEDIGRWHECPYAALFNIIPNRAKEYQNIFKVTQAPTNVCTMCTCTQNTIYSPVRNVLMGWTISVFLCQTKVNDVYLCTSEQHNIYMDFLKEKRERDEIYLYIYKKENIYFISRPDLHAFPSP